MDRKRPRRVGARRRVWGRSRAAARGAARPGGGEVSARRISAMLVLVLAGLLYASTASAQQQVRVTTDRTTIWQPGFQIIADIVDAGDVLTVVSRSGTFYEVELPRVTTAGRRTGYVARARVVPVGDAPITVPERAPR